MTCKNCIHYEVCLYKPCITECPLYKDKSQFVDISYEAVKLISCMVAENHIKEAEKQGFLRVKINAPKPKDIELYLTWDLNGKVDKAPKISLCEGDKVLFSTNEPIGIQNITEILKEINENGKH